MSDILEIAKVFNSIKGANGFITDYDFDKNGAINILDIMIVAKHFNETSY